MRYKYIPGSDNAYVTDDGRIFRHGKEVKGYLDSEGYPRYTVGGKRGRDRGHVFVAEAFCDGRMHGYVVDHIDCNKLNNRADNLEWVSPKENARRAGVNGLIKKGPTREIIALHTLTNKFIICSSQVQAALIIFNDRNKNKDINKNLKGKRKSVCGWVFEYAGGSNG